MNNIHMLIRYTGTGESAGTKANAVFFTDLMQQRHIQSPSQLNALRARLTTLGMDTVVHVVKGQSRASYGVLVGSDPWAAKAKAEAPEGDPGIEQISDPVDEIEHDEVTA